MLQYGQYRYVSIPGSICSRFCGVEGCRAFTCPAEGAGGSSLGALDLIMLVLTLLNSSSLRVRLS